MLRTLTATLRQGFWAAAVNTRRAALSSYTRHLEAQGLAFSIVI